VTDDPTGEPAADSPMPDDDQPAPVTGAEPLAPTALARVSSSLIDAFVAFFLYYAIFLLLVSTIVHPEAGKSLTADQQRTSFWLQLVASAVSALVFVVSTRVAGYTLGKRLTGFRLVDPAGEPASTQRLTVKYLVMFFLLPLPFGWLLVLFGVVAAAWQKDRRNVFDQLSGLRPQVVPRAPRAPRMRP